MKPTLLRTPLALSLLWLPLQTIAATDTGYQQPLKAMAELVDAPRQPQALVSPDKQYVLFASSPTVQTLADVAKAELKLAGTRINPANHTPSRAWPLQQLRLKHLTSLAEVKLPLPARNLHQPQWSPDAAKIAVLVEETDALYPYIYELKSKKLTRLSVAVNAALGLQYQWSSQSDALLLPTVLPTTQTAAANPSSTIKPAIQQSSGQKAAIRTYQDLLQNSADEASFRRYATAQLQLVPITAENSNSGRLLGQPGIFSEFSLSPNGELLLVKKLQQPFSYQVPYDAFPTSVEVWDLNGKLLKKLAQIPLQDKLPQGFDAVITGPREHSWRADAPATVIYAEAQDGGDMAAKVQIHDKVYSWAAPFTAPPQQLLALEMRYQGIYWGNDQLALAVEMRFADRMLQISRFAPAQPATGKTLFKLRSYNDAYQDPGTPLLKVGRYGTEVLDIRADDSILLSGAGASPQGNRPFLDQYSFQTGKTERLWQSADQWYDRLVAVLDQDLQQLLILREAPTVQPNFQRLNRLDGSITAVSDFPHPTPSFAKVQKQLVKYQRNDGVELSGNLYLPADYDASKGPLPVLIWAYPREFKDAATAGQLKESPFQFNRISFQGPLPHLAQGFAVFDDAKMPIIGTADQLPNDSFRSQLIAGAQAAVDKLVSMGIADPKRIAVGGHSYGAFMTANLLAHSDIFAAGIARSGAYNRSLTPFGFQGEERNFWQAQQVYQQMSPFNYADQINEPLLMIHGAEDNNSGTFPIQSQRLYAAMAGLGGQARLVMLPHEQHGYRARESILHMLWEQQQWLEQHVKNRP